VRKKIVPKWSDQYWEKYSWNLSYILNNSWFPAAAGCQNIIARFFLMFGLLSSLTDL
jgi:hypothetical protein